MPDTGFILCGAGSFIDDANPDWVNASTITTNNGSYDCSVSLAADQTSDFLYASQFGMSLPTGATIVGIEVQTDTSFNTSNTSFNVFMTKDGLNLSTGENILESGVDTQGGPTDLWGFSWTEAEVEASTFGVLFTVVSVGAAVTPSLDDVQVKIYYTAVVVDTGFESGVLANEFTTLSSGEQAALVTTSVYRGSYCYRSAAPGAADGHWSRWDIPDALTQAGRMYFRVTGWPAGAPEYIMTVTDTALTDRIDFRVENNASVYKVYWTFSEGVNDLTKYTISLDTWYRMEWKHDWSATGWKCTWGIVEGQGTLATQNTNATGGNTKASENIGYVQLGVNTFSASIDVRIDDVKITNDGADYPLGPVAIMQSSYYARRRMVST